MRILLEIESGFPASSAHAVAPSFEACGHGASEFEFLRLIIESGRSSYDYLQNVYPTPDREELSLALMLAETHLSGCGAWRVHGGGFAGTTLNFVPQRKLVGFVKDMEAVFGAHCCTVLDIRPVGPACVKLGA